VRVLKTQSINGKEHSRDPVSTLSRVIEVSKNDFVATHSNIRLSKLPDQHSRIDHHKKQLLLSDGTRHRSTSQKQSSDHRRPQRPSHVEKEKVASTRELPKESRRRGNDQYSASQNVAG
jgi:hypothetical protein